MRILVLGGTGSVGTLVVAEALRHGHDVIALARNPQSAARILPPEVALVKGDVTTSEGLPEALEGVDAVIATLNGDPRRIDYGGMRNVLHALSDRRVHIVLMSVVGAANVGRLDLFDWKRRGERLVRASGNDYTIVRPAWFDMQSVDQEDLDLGQQYRVVDLSPSSGVIGRQQIARILVAAAGNSAARRRTFDLLAKNGSAPSDLDELFAALQPDPPDGVDAVYDPDNLPISDEPVEIRQDLAGVSSR